MCSSERESYGRKREHLDEFEQRKSEIRRLNDRLRQKHIGGFVTITRGVQALGNDIAKEVLEAIQKFDTFTSENDPLEEHDVGVVRCAGLRILWKIDYWDKRLEFGSPNPADPSVTARVLTIMLADEY